MGNYFKFAPIEMLQEKASVVTDGSVTGAQTEGPPELVPNPSHLGLPTTPSIPQGNEPNQVKNRQIVKAEC